MLNSLDLFSGYGGMTIGLRKYCKPIGYCEIERYAQGIIASRIADGELPVAPIYPDITKLRGEINTADIITGGFPCQDISVAGSGKGLGGERSGLFFEIIRLTKETRAPFVFLENVPAIRTRGLREVIRAFTEIGYDCRWTCLSASSVGAKHKRERWFLLAHSNGARFQKERSKQQATRLKHSCVLGNENDNWSEPEKSWWSTEPNVGRVVDGCPNRVDRIKALGNGVVPLQAKTAFEKLMGLT